MGRPRGGQGQGDRVSASGSAGQRRLDSDHGADGGLPERVLPVLQQRGQRATARCLWQARIQGSDASSRGLRWAARRVAAVMGGELVEAADRWVVPVVGLTVTQCRLDYTFSLVLANDGEGSYYVAIEEAFTVAQSADADAVVVDPEGDPVQMAPALR